MIDMLRDLMAHKWYADATMLAAVRGHEVAAADPEIRDLLLHTLVSNRFWLSMARQVAFDLETESQPPASLDTLSQRYRDTQAEEASWMAAAGDADMARMVTSRFFPDQTFSVLQGLTQVCLHSHGHRAQVAKMLRRHGGEPPPTDYILWVGNGRPKDKS
jgi:uncharacterized damage-inducible protein DinB